jgi:hypothetical protein
MLDLLDLQKVMDNYSLLFMNFPAEHLLTNQKQYGKWIKRLRYYLSKVHPSVPLFIIDNAISTSVDPSQQAEFIRMCNAFFSNCVICFVSEDIWYSIGRKKLYGKDAFDWIAAEYGSPDHFSIYLALRECRGQVLFDNLDVEAKAHAFEDNMNFVLSNLTSEELLAMNMLLWFNNDSLAIKYLDMNKRVSTADEVIKFFREWAPQLNITLGQKTALSDTSIQRQKNEKKTKCLKCKKSGHTANMCIVPPEKCPGLLTTGKKKKEKPASKALKSAFFGVTGSIEHNAWYFVTGADSHVCNDLSLMFDVKSESRTLVSSGGTYSASLVGSVKLSFKQTDGSTTLLVLTNVLYISDFDSNIVSLFKADSTLSFCDDKVIVDWSNGGTSVFAQTQPNGLLKVNAKVVRPA